MKILLVFLFVLGCKSIESQTKVDPLAISGETGRDVNLLVKSIDPSKSKDNQPTICAIGLSGEESMNSEVAEKRLVCANAKDGEKAVRLQLKDLPYPAYITVFHDQNHNRVLDFGSFDIMVVKTEGPVEGIGIIDDVEDKNNKDKFSMPIWAEIGDNYLTATITYGDLPFWKFVKEQAWNSFYGWYVSKTKPNPKNIKK